MNFEEALNESNQLCESFHRYHLKYVGTRNNYKVHDGNPYVLVIDDNYNVDGNGRSILGINLNYYKGHRPSLINDVNKSDNKAGFRGFETKLKLKKFLNKDENIEEYEATERKKRYENIKDEFPFLMKFLRRYKIKGPDGKPGVLSKRRAIIK